MVRFISESSLANHDVMNFMNNEEIMKKVVGRDIELERMPFEEYFKKRKNLSYRIDDYEFVIIKVGKDSSEVEYDFSALWQRYLFKRYKGEYKEALLARKEQLLLQADREYQTKMRSIAAEHHADLEKINSRVDGVIYGDRAMNKSNSAYSIVSSGTNTRIEYN